MVAITQEEADTLERLHIVHSFHQEPSARSEKGEGKKLFRVSARGTEYFPELDIEADTQEAAEKEYHEAWEHGGFLSPKYELKITSAEIEEGENVDG